ncbi:MAG: DUF3846 domain-containing protein [Clostridia bacterium]|nr:DUF3846 domain-containing protein [Clostridia bacterium]
MLEKEKKIKVLIVEPRKEPYVKEIDNTLEEKQKIVGGLIEFVELEETVDLICNDEGKMNNLEMNRIITNDIICGTFIICGQKDGYSISLTDEKIEKYKKYFSLKVHSVPIELLKRQYRDSSNLLNYDLRGIEKLLKLQYLWNN